MKNRKLVFVGYAFFDRTGIRKYLEKMALRGWLVKNISGSRWEFVRIEPQKLHFSISYLPKKVTGGTSADERREEFMEYCRHSGWKLAAQGTSMLIWYHASENPVPIETDPEVELDTIHKCAKEGYLRCRYIFLAQMLIWVGLLVARQIGMSLSGLADVYLEYGLMLAVMGLWSGYELILYYIWRKKAIKAVHCNRDFVETKSFPLVGMIMQMMLYLVCLIWWPAMRGESLLSSIIGFCVFIITRVYIESKLLDDDAEDGETKGTTWGSLLKLLVIIGLVPVVFILLLFLLRGL